MTLVKDRMRELLDVLDGIGVDPLAISADAIRPTGEGISFRTCADFQAACRAFRVKDKTTRGQVSVRSGYQPYAALAGDLHLSHACFPHLECWTVA